MMEGPGPFTMSSDIELQVSLRKTPAGISHVALRPNDALSPVCVTLQMVTGLLDDFRSE